MTLTCGPNMSARGVSTGGCARLRWARPQGERGGYAAGPVQEWGAGEGRPSGAAQELERGGWAYGGEQVD